MSNPQISSPSPAVPARLKPVAPRPRVKSIVNEIRDIGFATELIRLGARISLVQDMTTELSFERLTKLYKEIKGGSPSKGQLPYSIEWFLVWQPNIHSSLFMNIYIYLEKTSVLDPVEALTKTYRIYMEQIGLEGLDPELSITRAWRLVKFFDAGMLTMSTCTRCRGKFVNYPYENEKLYVCGLCDVPGRAGHGLAKGRIGMNTRAQHAH